MTAPHGALMERAPRIRARHDGEGDGTFHLEVGRGVRIRPDVLLDVWAKGTNHLSLGDDVEVQEGARIELRSGSVELGECVDVRSLVLIKCYGTFRVGGHTVLSRGVFVQCEERIEVGEHCGIGEFVSLIDSDHTHDGTSSPVLRQPLRVDPIEIGSNVLVARGTAVLRGARVGANSLIAANSVVLKGEHPGGSLIAGTPAKVRRPLAAAGDADGAA